MIQDVCDLQLTRKDCRSIPDCAWYNRDGRCSHRTTDDNNCRKCGLDWQPVCSGDGEQFDNPCLAKCHGVKDWTEGECPKIPTLENICVLQSSRKDCKAIP